MRVLVMPPARRQLRELVMWWRKNRPAAPGRVRSEFGRALGVLASHPHIGRPYEERPGVRTFLLRGTPYLLFYEVLDGKQELHVLAVWSGMRGEGPPL